LRESGVVHGTEGKDWLVPSRKSASNPKSAAVSKQASQAQRMADRDSSTDEADSEGLESRDQAETDTDDDEIVEVSGEVIEPEEETELDASEIPQVDEKSAAITHFDPLQAYLREVQRHPLLTPEQEHDLAVKYASSGDVAAAATLVSSNLRLVVKIAYEYRRAYRNIMDLIQEGNIGLMQAVKRYDPYRGVKLSSYAAWWIRAYILRFVLNNWRLVKLGTTQAQRKLFFNLNKEKARLASLGIEPTSAEIAQRLNVDEVEVIEMDRRLASGEASLDAPVGDNDGRAVSRAGPDTAMADGEFNMMLRERLASFRTTLHSEKDIAIFDERLVAEDPLTLQELGDRFGVSRERVRQLEARLTSKLREYLKNEFGEAVEVG
jgi:RNA polymerase sigma-32 factor